MCISRNVLRSWKRQSAIKSNSNAIQTYWQYKSKQYKGKFNNRSRKSSMLVPLWTVVEIVIVVVCMNQFYSNLYFILSTLYILNYNSLLYIKDKRRLTNNITRYCSPWYPYVSILYSNSLQVTSYVKLYTRTSCSELLHYLLVTNCSY